MLPRSSAPTGERLQVSPRILAELPPRLVLHDMGAIPPSLAFLGYALGALLWLGFVVFAYRAARGRDSAGLWIGVGLLAPLAALVALMLALPPNFQTRYLTAASPFAALAIARGLGSLRPAWLGIALSALAAAGALALSLDQSWETAARTTAPRATRSPSDGAPAIESW